MDKAKLASMFNLDDDETYQSKPLDQQKMSQYTASTVKKSKREKDAEAAEAKRKEEEAQAAKAYADFLDAFEGGPSSSSKRGGGSFVRAIGSGDGSDKAYKPSLKGLDERPNVIAPAEDEPVSKPKPKGKRAMDMFLEEIKREQADREVRHRQRPGHSTSATAMAAYENQRGSRDTGDPETTNIFVANLPPHVTEDSLGNFFARHGPIGSVKVMWPRGDATVGPGNDITSSRRMKNSGLNGFVQYMKRKDAEACVREMDGFEWGGSILRVGWSKAVPLASKPIYGATRSPGPDRHQSSRLSDSPSRSPYARYRSRSPRRDRDRHRHSRSRSRDRYDDRDRRDRDRHRHSDYDKKPHTYRRSRSWSRSSGRWERSRSRSRSRSAGPWMSRDVQEFIQMVAREIRERGNEYEEAIRAREKRNPKYSFLWDEKSLEHGYFVSLSAKFIPKLEFDDEGSQSVYSTDSAEESEQERLRRKGVLGKLAHQRFESILRAQTGRRGDIARAMVFSLQHAEAASQIADIIIASLLVDGTAVPRKVARLHLICDILHNSAAPVSGAWKYRQEFQTRLPVVFDHLSTIYHSFPGRITAETFKKQILAVVEVWEDWIVFPPDFTTELRVRLEGGEAAIGQTKAVQKVVQATGDVPKEVINKFKTSSFQPATAAAMEPAIATVTEDGGAFYDIDGDPVDLDGEPVDLDGEHVDLDSEPADLDGEPVDLDDEPINLDGENVDLDGEPLDGESSASRRPESKPVQTADSDRDGTPMDESD